MPVLYHLDVMNSELEFDGGCSTVAGTRDPRRSLPNQNLLQTFLVPNLYSSVSECFRKPACLFSSSQSSL